MKNFIISFSNNFLGVFEIIIFYNIAKNFHQQNDIFYLFYVLAIYVAFINLRYFFLVLKSNSNILYYITNHRTIQIAGGQGIGKTSLMCKVASLSGRPVYSLTPLKIKGKMVKKLKYKHLTLEKKLEENAFCIFDEMTLVFNNTSQGDKKLTLDLKAFEINLQLLRHFYNGNFLYASVDTDRAIKIIEEKFLHKWEVQGQRTENYSIFLAPILRVIFKNKYIGTMRIWEVQTLNQIKENNYIYDLSNDEKNTKKNKFANLLEIYSYNNKDFEYNDRYLKTLYDALPIQIDDEEFTSLLMDEKTVVQQYPTIWEFLVVNKGLKLKEVVENDSE